MLNCLLHTLSYTSKWLEGLARPPGIFSSRAVQPADMLCSLGRGAVAGFPDKGGKACCPSQSLQGTAHRVLRARGTQKMLVTISVQGSFQRFEGRDKPS